MIAELSEYQRSEIEVMMNMTNTLIQKDNVDWMNTSTPIPLTKQGEQQ